jgi:hypothetical protein
MAPSLRNSIDMPSYVWNIAGDAEAVKLPVPVTTLPVALAHASDASAGHQDNAARVSDTYHDCILTTVMI